ncbi:MAG: MATE family efflux transporter, partial [Pseudomonadota bacterium]
MSVNEATEPGPAEGPTAASAVAAGSGPAPGSGEWQALLRLAWPMMLAQFFIMATGFLDTLMAGRYGAADLGGVQLAGNLMWPIFLLLTGVTMALTPVIAQLRGRGDLQGSGGYVRQGLWLAALASLLMVGLLRSAEPFLRLVGVADEAVVRIAADYLRAASWGVPAVVLYVALRQVCEGLGQTLPGMLIAGAVVPINGVLNYAWIYGKFGFPELGGVGCGHATAVVFWIELSLMVFFVRQPFFRVLGVFSRFEWPRFAPLLELVRVGLPIGFAIFAEMVIFSVISLMISRIGVIDLAAHSIVGNINWLTYVLPMGLGGAASIRVGYFVGAGNLPAARQVCMLALRLALIYGVLVSLLLVLGRQWLVSIYTLDPAVQGIATALILFVAVYQIFDDTNAVAIGALRGYKDTTASMVYGLVGFWVIALPVAVALGEGYLGLPELGVYGYWAGLTLGLCLVAGAACWRLFATSARPDR